MGVPVLIMGESGTGKSYSLRDMPADKTAVINVLNKPFPFKSQLRSYHSRDFDKVISAVRRAETRAMVIDDFGYLITNLYMRYSYGPEKMHDQYDLYKLLGNKVWTLITTVQKELPDEEIVYFVMHTDSDALGHTVPATVGRMLNEKINLVGMFSTLFLSVYEGGEYRFVTNNRPPAKSAPGMFEDSIPNNLFEADKAMREYWGFQPL